MRVIVSGTRIPQDLAVYCARAGIEIRYLNGVTDPVELCAAVKDTDFYFLGGDEFLSDDVLSVASRLRAVSFMGTGAAGFIDLASALSHGVSVLTTPGANAPAVAEFAVGQALGLRRQIFAGLLGRDTTPGDVQEFTGSTVGILGLGAIGSRLARILRQGFDCSVTYHSRSGRPDLEDRFGLRHVPLDELFRISSTVFVCCPLTEETTGLIGQRELGAGVDYIVSIADPRVFRLADLGAALADSTLRGAALDIDYLGAPGTSPEDTASLARSRHESLFVTTHQAASSSTAWQRMQDRAVENLIAAVESVTA